jgi:hypothetical protein
MKSDKSGGETEKAVSPQPSLSPQAYKLSFQLHGNHTHFSLGETVACKDVGCTESHGAKDDGVEHKQTIATNDEGCPCCLAAIDLDEVATALNEIAQNRGNLENHGNSLGELGDFSSGAHWGIFLGISGPLALVGLTAAFRNIEGTLNNRQILKQAIAGLEQDIEKYRRENAGDDVIERLKAFKKTLEYSEFDTNFNLVVPGVINGAASTIVLSSAIVSSPWALPVIALYAGCQTMRNAYDFYRTWNEILPEELRENLELNTWVGIRKINQITDSKRKFYAANTLGFATFATGAVITTVSALSVVGAPGLLVGIPLLAAGAVSTGITNNIWTGKFRPRNGDLGTDRKELDLKTIEQKIGAKRELKKLLKNYRDRHLPTKPLRRFGSSLLSSLPFLNEKGQKMLHRANQSRISESTSSDQSRLDLLERVSNIEAVFVSQVGQPQKRDELLKKISGLEQISEDEREEFRLIFSNGGNDLLGEIFEACKKLEIDAMVLERFIKNAILRSDDEHDISLTDREAFSAKLIESRLFTFPHTDGTLIFNLPALAQNHQMREYFMEAMDEVLLFDCVKRLEYEQYGLNDFYWALKKQNKTRSSLPAEGVVKVSSPVQNSLHVEDIPQSKQDGFLPPCHEIRRRRRVEKKSDSLFETCKIEVLEQEAKFKSDELSQQTDYRFLHPTSGQLTRSKALDKFDFSTRNQDLASNPDNASELIQKSLFAALAAIDPKGEIALEDLATLIFLAIKHGGVGNKKDEFKADLAELGCVDVAGSFNLAAKFSTKFQEAASKNGLFTGNQNAAAIVPMRLKRVTPDAVIAFVQKAKKVGEFKDEQVSGLLESLKLSPEDLLKKEGAIATSCLENDEEKKSQEKVGESDLREDSKSDEDQVVVCGDPNSFFATFATKNPSASITPRAGRGHRHSANCGHNH